MKRKNIMENLNNKITLLSELTEKKMTFYHGTCTTKDFDGNDVKIQKLDKCKDSGAGFYLTSSHQQASNWAHSRVSKFKGKPIVKKYQVNFENTDDSVKVKFLLDFQKSGRDRFKTKEWADWVVFYRTNVIEINNEQITPNYEKFYADIVYGMVCDNRIKRSFDSYCRSKQTKENLETFFENLGVDKSVDQLVIKNQNLLNNSERPFIQYLGEVDVMEKNFNFDHNKPMVKRTTHSEYGDISGFENEVMCELIFWITPIIAKNHNVSLERAMGEFILSDTYKYFCDIEYDLQGESWRNILFMFEAEQQFGDPFRYGDINHSDFPWENIKLDDAEIECFIGVLEEYAYEKGITGHEMLKIWEETIIPQEEDTPEMTLSQDIMGLGSYCYYEGVEWAFERIDKAIQQFYKPVHSQS